MRRKFVAFNKVVKISTEMQEMINKLMGTGMYPGESDIFREGLVQLFRKVDPPYLRPSINEEIKKEVLKKTQLIKAIPDKEFIDQNMIDHQYYTDGEGKEWVLYRRMSNYLGAIPVEMAKDWIIAKDPLYLWHQENYELDTISYEQRLKDQTQRTVLLTQHGLEIND